MRRPSAQLASTPLHQEGKAIAALSSADSRNGNYRRHNNTCRSKSSANSSAEPDNLFEAIQKQYDEDSSREALAGSDTAHRNLPIFVKTIMDTWTLQKGYPVITVTRSYATGTATVTQVRTY
ncbi:hypothetical protein PR048_008875 [Dryococelus australis]|uniref:Uncharacterized protein n=1 Tax=Dryococelus australis TaxID=614101 RepID=A0ABQ9HYC4_9NEOP|nr:hypothetical protein PR048_008875 [Dryococelus australis]